MVGRFLGEVRFIFDAQILDSIEDVIKRAQQQIVIVSPYNDFPLPGRMRSALEKAAADKDISIQIVCRKEEEQKQRKYLDWLIGLGAEVYLVERLHAKIYSNESFGIITSMNLRETSMLNSREIGVRLTTLSEVRQYVDDLIEFGEPVAPVRKVAKPKPPAAHPPKVEPKQASVQGSCIRCGEASIAYNPEKPLCPKCFQSWNRYQDPDYSEKHCHRCGEERANISFAKPLCRSCYREAASTT